MPIEAQSPSSAPCVLVRLYVKPTTQHTWMLIVPSSRKCATLFLRDCAQFFECLFSLVSFTDSLATHAESDSFGNITGCDTHESTNAIRNLSAKFAIRNSIELTISPSTNEFIPVSLIWRKFWLDLKILMDFFSSPQKYSQQANDLSHALSAERHQQQRLITINTSRFIMQEIHSQPKAKDILHCKNITRGSAGG